MSLKERGTDPASALQLSISDSSSSGVLWAHFRWTIGPRARPLLCCWTGQRIEHGAANLHCIDVSLI